jgi:DNA polymerase-1
MYEPYKATRQKMPEDLVVQVPYIKDLVRYHGVPQLEMEGYEADDLIATLARHAQEENLEVVIVSGDKDLYQLVRDPWVRQWDPQRDRMIDEKGVEERFGVKPGQMLDLLALMGDSSDNVPGVPGVGEKTAQKLLKQWESLEHLFDHVQEVSGASLQKKLQENRDLAYLSKELVSLKQDAPIPQGLGDFVCRPPQQQELVKLYEELGFKKLLESLRQEGEISQEPSPSEPIESRREDWIILAEEELREMFEELEKQRCFSVDLETTSEDPMQARLVGIALSWKDHQGFYIPVGHSGEGSGRQLSEKVVLEALKPYLERGEPTKVGQNIKYEWVVFKRHGISLKGIYFDTMVANYLLDPGSHSHRLERIAGEHLGEEMISYTDITGKGKNQISFDAVDVERAAEYACEDAEVTWRLAPLLKQKMQEAHLEELYHSLEIPLIQVLAKMEYQGILVDAQKLDNLSLELEKTLDQKAGEIHRIAGEEFNIQSPKQLAKILFEKLELPVIKKTKTGPSTDMSVLEDLAAEHPIADQVLAYRSIAKLKGTYAEALPKLIHPETGRIHTSYNQTVTATGRLSSSNPNLQNIPIRSEEGRKIREAFIPAPGHVLLSADYSQIELRILAHYSMDEHLVEAFFEGEDIHRRTAAEMLGIAPHEVTLEMRRQAKAINFGIIYGMGPFGLAKQLRISNTSAKAAIERYFERYRGVKQFVNRVIEETREEGYCKTLLGRRRPIPELQSRNRTVRQQGERLAVNTTIQGTAADLIKKAMIHIDEAPQMGNIKTRMLLQVHDELIFEVPLEELESVQSLVKEKMENVWSLAVPLKIDMGWGENWAKAHPD